MELSGRARAGSASFAALTQRAQYARDRLRSALDGDRGNQKQPVSADQHDLVARELNRARRHEHPCTLIMIDAYGDRAMPATASLLREHDVVAPDPTERGLIVLAPETDALGSAALVARLLEHLPAMLGAPVTISAATFPEDGVTLTALKANARRNHSGPYLRATTVEVARARRVKRARRYADITIATAVLAAASPLLAVVALAIRLDSPGPVLFRQLRTGRDGVRFGMWKFRSMSVDAEARKQQFAALNALDAPNFKIKNDPRITRVGRVIRRLSVDEFPQMINVVRGEMTLVGPRPTSVPAEDHELWQTERLDVTPGLTGMWQVTGRGTTMFPDRCRLDIRYTRRRNVRLDLRIVARTVPAVVLGRGVT